MNMYFKHKLNKFDHGAMIPHKQIDIFIFSFINPRNFQKLKPSQSNCWKRLNTVLAQVNWLTKMQLYQLPIRQRVRKEKRKKSIDSNFISFNLMFALSYC